MTDALPPAIVTELDALGRALGALCRQHAEAPLAATETAVRAAVLDRLPGLLRAVLGTSQTSLRPGGNPPAQRCPHCHQRVGLHSWRPRTVLTSCGRLTLDRPYYHCPACRQGFSPTDQALGLPARARLSGPLTDWVVQLGATTTFAEAARLLALLTGLLVSAETVRQQTETRGQALRTAEAAAMARVVETQEAADPVDAPPGELVVETDGVLIRYRQPDRTTAWHEVKAAVVFGYRDGRLVAPSYVAARETAAAFGPRLLTEAARRGALEILEWVGSPLRRQVARLRPVAVLGDGAKWIWGLAADHFDQRTEILDYYHAAEHLFRLAGAVFGDGTAATQEWVSQQQRALLTHGSAPLLAALHRLPRPPTTEARATVRLEREYFRRNARRLAYPTFRTQGLPIGSGAVESTGKRLVQQRLKRPGASWSRDGADGVLAVRCRLLSERPLAA